MTSELIIKSKNKENKYLELLPQIESLVADENDLTANLANIAAALKQAFNFFWVGFYFVKSNNENQQLVLGPFQGPIACTRIDKGKGACGVAWQDKKTILLPDVNKFSQHIACNVLSKSEIVVPILKDGNVYIVLDIDSDKLDDFDNIDQKYLEKLALFIGCLLEN